MDRHLRTLDDVLTLLDGLFAPEADRWTADAASWWDGFYADRSKPVPFFAAKPDENLVSWLDRGLLTPGRALDLGCGPGRNALHLAAAGFEVDAVDLSPAALAWARAATSPSPASPPVRWAPSWTTATSTAAAASRAAWPTPRNPCATSSPA